MNWAWKFVYNTSFDAAFLARLNLADASGTVSHHAARNCLTSLLVTSPQVADQRFSAASLIPISVKI
ncbi:hypothetical protein BM477_00400 [Boudabousia marimammalium]|uniref:Uncharacterized protein n=1 Tax=Boudabousia marimammalium TaxID=156892 RepID=A0A1Q5PSX2_9ACTO|nr:hypothetical protein BM477_00400 [Boudabousia marimammalium]